MLLAKLLVVNFKDSFVIKKIFKIFIPERRAAVIIYFQLGIFYKIVYDR